MIARRENPTEVLVITFLLNAVIGMVWVGVPLFAIHLGARPVALGVIGTAASTTYVLMAATCGRLSDRWGRRIFLRISLLQYAGALLALTRSTAWPHAAAAMVVAVAGMGMFWPAYMALFADLAPSNRLSGFLSIYNVAWSAGVAVGSLAGGLLAQRAYSLPCHVGAAIALGCACRLWYRGSGVRQAQPVPQDDNAGEDSSRATAYLIISWVGGFAVYFGVGVIRVLFPKLALELGFEKAAVGILLAVISASQTLSFAALGVWQGWHYRLAPLLLLEAGAALGLLIVAGAGAAGPFALGFALVGIASGLTYTSGYYYGVHGQTSKGSRTGLHEAISSAGSALGPITGGLIASAVSLRASFLFCAGVVVIAAVVQAFLPKAGATVPSRPSHRNQAP
jgi:MFS family permease